MSFGKLYTYGGNSRSTAIIAVAKANKLDLELVDPKEGGGVTSPEYTKLNPLSQIPTFQGADGYVLTESLAIAIYITSQNGETTLLGKTKQDYASIVKWMSFANGEMLPRIGGYFGPLTGRDPYNKKSVDDSLKAANKAVGVIEQHLLLNTFLVGERLTLADLFVAGLISRGFQYVFDKKWRIEYPSTTRWFETVINQPIYKAAVDKVEFCEEALKNQPPKKDKEEKPKKEQAPKATAKPKAKEVDEDEEEEEKPAPKPKHPLEALEKPTLILDDWKRKYSNEETREAALPWFWTNFKPEEYSLWRVDYKYNDELTQTFMTANLIGGFFTRLEASRKYLFGCASVYGVKDDSMVQGAFIVRGQEAIPAFDVAPDVDSYEFTKLDHTKKEDREYVDDQWSWDKPIEVKGKTYEWADGKVFK